MPHSPIDHLLPAANTNVPSSPISNSAPSTTSYGKESAPVPLTPELSSQSEATAEAAESNKESFKKKENPKVRLIADTPTIDPASAQAGLKVAPSASTFPSPYSVKVPMLSDEQIEQGRKQSVFSGTRWLAELCTYILWQSRIDLKTINGKTVRERADTATLWMKIKRLMWK